VSDFQLQKHPHRRLNALTREWVVVSPHRTQRPWLGQTEARPATSTPSYDPTCYMCPGNHRAGGAHNPVYKTTYVFDNDYPALLLDTPAGGCDVQGLLVAKSEPGLCRVMCFSPRHNRSLSQMDPAEVQQVVDVWTDQYAEMAAMPQLNYVQIFENRGAMMGCSNPHPHCQIWGSAAMPNEPLKEQASQSEYLSRTGSCLLCDCRSATSPPSPSYPPPSAIRWPGFSGNLPPDMIACSTLPFLTPWDSTRSRPTGRSIPNGICTPIFFLRCCGPLPCENSWWDTKC
jgi:galactose-1-phosphate uridylyltransferase (family 1)